MCEAAANKADLTCLIKKGQSIASWSRVVIQRNCGLLWLDNECGSQPTGNRALLTAACWDTLTCVCLKGMSVCTGLCFKFMGQAFLRVCAVLGLCFFSLFSYLIVCMYLSGSGCICVFICRLLCVCVSLSVWVGWWAGSDD